MWLCEEEQVILKYLKDVGEAGAGVREICRKAWSKDAFKENERWAYPFLGTLKDKNMIQTTASGTYCLPPKEEKPEPKRRV